MTASIAAGVDPKPARPQVLHMVQETLKRLGIPPSGDYVRAFDVLARWSTPGQDRVARRKRAAAAFRIGDYRTALEDARWCLHQRPDDVEADVLHGLAALGAAASELLPLPMVGAGSGGLEEGPLRLLDKARHSFARVQDAAPGDARARLGQEAAQELARLLQDLPVAPVPGPVRG